jgi:hypothetical protein
MDDNVWSDTGIFGLDWKTAQRWGEESVAFGESKGKASQDAFDC